MLICVCLFAFGEHWKLNKSWTVCTHHQHVETVGCGEVCFLWAELSGRVKPDGDSWNIQSVSYGLCALAKLGQWRESSRSCTLGKLEQWGESSRSCTLGKLGQWRESSRSCTLGKLGQWE